MKLLHFYYSLSKVCTAKGIKVNYTKIYRSVLCIFSDNYIVTCNYLIKFDIPLTLQHVLQRILEVCVIGHAN